VLLQDHAGHWQNCEGKSRILKVEMLKHSK
jgi:hypothetical protein